MTEIPTPRTAGEEPTIEWWQKRAQYWEGERDHFYKAFLEACGDWRALEFRCEELLTALKAVVENAVGQLDDPLWIVAQTEIEQAKAAIAHAEART